MDIERIQNIVITKLKPDVVLVEDNLKLCTKSNDGLIKYCRVINFIEISIVLHNGDVLVLDISLNRHKNRRLKVCIERNGNYSDFILTALYTEESMHFQSMVAGTTKFTDFNFFRSIIKFINETEEQFFNMFHLYENDKFTNLWSVE